MNEDLNNFLWVKLKDASTADDFLVVKETLTRMGIAAKRQKNRLLQLCYLYHTNGKYFICHHKELKKLYGEEVEEMTDRDLDIRDQIAHYLESWNLLKVQDQSLMEDIKGVKTSLRVIKHEEKKNWNLISLFSFKKYLSD